jgi:hypothetical protein
MNIRPEQQGSEIITRQEAEESVTIAKDVRQKIRMLLGKDVTGQ